MGMSSHCDDPLIPGGVKEFDQASGALLATYFAMPSGQVGASVWTSVAATSRSVFATTGNAPGGGGDSYSVVRLDPNTLARQDAWTVPGVAGTDDDFGASPTLFTATVGGVRTPMVAACNKNGVLYAWNQNHLSAGPLWSLPVSAGTGEGCLAAPVWDGAHLYQAAGPTTIGGVSYGGSVRELDPATGAALWERGFAEPVFGTPTLDGAGVMAVATYDPATSVNTASLLDARDGTVLATLPTNGDAAFGQPVFAGRSVFVPGVKLGLNAFSVPS
jgi:hypothetical protein